MLKFSDSQKTQLAIANLSQLSYFVGPQSGSVCVPLPYGKNARLAVEQSLRVLNIDLSDGGMGDVMVEMPKGQEDDISTQFAHGSDMLLSEAAVLKLIASGVRHPLLDIMANSKTQAA